MITPDVYKSYFNGFNEISNFCNNDAKTNVIASLKILSYITLVIPAIVYGLSSLCGRVSKTEERSSQDQRIQDIAKEPLLPDPDPVPEPITNSEPVKPPSKYDDMLKKASEEKINRWRVKSYCKIAKQQIEESLKEEASKTLDIAVNSIDLSNHLETKCFCKIAKLRLALNPGVVPAELIRAEQLEAVERSRNERPERAGHLLPGHASDLCLLAKTYQLAGDTSKAKELVETARNCANRNKARTMEYIGNLSMIADVQFKLGLVSEALKTIHDAIPQIESLRECAPEVTCLTDFAITLIPHEPAEARHLINQAERRLAPYKGKDGYFWNTRSEEQIEKALKALEEAKK